MKRKIALVLAASAMGLSGCSTLGSESFGSGHYSLVRPKPQGVGNGSLVVHPPREWNKQRRWFFDDIRWVEDWTLNGPLLDDMTFVSGLPSGHYLVQQRKREAQQVPKFRDDMTAPEIVAMLESAYRVRGGAIDFKTISLQPRQFLGWPGFQFDYEHLDADELWRRGRAVGAVIDGRLYLIMLDGARAHYFPDALNDFESMVQTAQLRR